MKEVNSVEPLLRESLHFPNMPMINADYPVSGINTNGLQVVSNHNTNTGNEQLTIRSSVYD